MQQSITYSEKKHKATAVPASRLPTEKTWTYAEITAAAEKGIQTGIDLARRYPAGTSEHRFQEAVTWGIYWGWYRLTFGCQMQDDVTRLKNLAEAV